MFCIVGLLSDDSADHEFHQLLMDYVGQLSLNVNIQKLLQCQAKSRQWLTDYDKRLKDDAEAERNPKVFIHSFVYSFIHSLIQNFYLVPFQDMSPEVLPTQPWWK